MLFTPPGGGPEKPESEFTREELLWLRRTSQEGDHYLWLHNSQIMWRFQPSVQAVIDDPKVKMDKDLDLGTMCNKTIPMYFLPSPSHGVVAIIIHNYIYRRWFHPYRTETNAGQFVYRFITPKDLGNCIAPPSEALSNTLATFNGILCAKVEDYTRTSRAHQETSNPNHEPYVLRPLFKALMAIVCCADYDGEDSTTVGRFPVHLVRTGVEDGLSAPISFHDEIAAHRMEPMSENVVKTTLEAATDFIMALEAREIAVFGIQPDPASVAEVLTDDEGHELTRLPSTQWVSDKNAAKWGWGGRGRRMDEYFAPIFERRGVGGYKSHLFMSQMHAEGRALPDIVTIDGGLLTFRFNPNHLPGSPIIPDKVLRTTYSKGKTTFWDEQDCVFCEADVAKLFAPAPFQVR